MQILCSLDLKIMGKRIAKKKQAWVLPFLSKHLLRSPFQALLPPVLAQHANLTLPKLHSLSHHLLFLDLFSKLHLGIITSPVPYFKIRFLKKCSDFSGAAVHCQQNRRTCRRPECPGNQATSGCAPALSFFSFSSTQWPLTETNHLIKYTVLPLYSLKYSISMAVVYCSLTATYRTSLCASVTASSRGLHYGKCWYDRKIENQFVGMDIGPDENIISPQGQEI